MGGGKGELGRKRKIVGKLKDNCGKLEENWEGDNGEGKKIIEAEDGEQQENCFSIQKNHVSQTFNATRTFRY